MLPPQRSLKTIYEKTKNAHAATAADFIRNFNQ